MKVTSSREINFNPVNLIIRLDNREELTVLGNLFNTACITDSIPEIDCYAIAEEINKILPGCIHGRNREITTKIRKHPTIGIQL